MAAFVATNLDDVVLVSLLFALTGTGPLRSRQVVAGQYLGLGVLVALGAAGAFGALLLPDRAAALLGLIPLAMGVHGLLRRDDDDDEPPLRAGGVAGVAGITIANGGDNVAVYVPFFASVGGDGMVVVVAVFAVLTAALCLAGHRIGTHPAALRLVERHGRIAVPLLLIALGVAILATGL